MIDYIVFNFKLMLNKNMPYFGISKKGRPMKKTLILTAALIATLSADSALNEIKSKCVSEWGTDYSMIKYCFNKQVRARSIVVGYPDNEIKSSCKRQWGTDYSMVKYCFDKQTKAKRELGL